MWDLRETVARVNAVGLTTLGACGDVNRNVMCHPNPWRSRARAQANALAERLSARVTPLTEMGYPTREYPTVHRR